MVKRKKQLYFPERVLWHFNLPPTIHTLQISCSHGDGRMHLLNKLLVPKGATWTLFSKNCHCVFQSVWQLP